ncbi:MAG: flavodoxin family protein [Phycisphaerales bacterium JB040]
MSEPGHGDSVRVAVVYHSGFGHTEAVARSVASGAERSGVAGVTLIAVADLPDPKENPEAWTALHEADAIVFGSPTYMGSVSAEFKAFMDRSGGFWFDQAWRGKLAAGFTNAGELDGDKRITLTVLQTFAAQHGMLWVPAGFLPGDAKPLNRMGSFSGLMTQADNAPADTTPPEEDHESARRFGGWVARCAARWALGAVRGGA